MAVPDDSKPPGAMPVSRSLRGLLFGHRYLGCDDPKRSKNNSKLPGPSSPWMTACRIRTDKKLGAGHRFPDGSSPEIRLRNKLLELRLLGFPDSVRRALRVAALPESCTCESGCRR